MRIGPAFILPSLAPSLFIKDPPPVSTDSPDGKEKVWVLLLCQHIKHKQTEGEMKWDGRWWASRVHKQQCTRTYKTNNTVHVSLSNVSLPRRKNKESKFVFLAVWYQSAIVFCLFFSRSCFADQRSGDSCLVESRKDVFFRVPFLFWSQREETSRRLHCGSFFIMLFALPSFSLAPLTLASSLSSSRLLFAHLPFSKTQLNRWSSTSWWLAYEE